MGKHPKTKAPGASDRAYGRLALNELTAERVAGWTVRAVAGETRRFVRPVETAQPATGDGVLGTMDALTIRVIDHRDRPAVGLRCGTCEVPSFASLDEQYAHFKSDWHCANLKRKAKGQEVLSAEAFAAAVAANAHDPDASASSSSGSSSEADEEADENDEVATTSEPVVEFTDGKSLFKVYKNILPRVSEEDFNPYTAMEQIRGSRLRWAVFLLRSGRFAGAIFDNDKALCHKTFQRYTTRRKQGGSQAAHDNAGGRAKSAGATLRRYNEAALKQDIAELLAAWKGLLADVDMIFISSGKNDRPTFFQGKPPVLRPDDSRLRKVPFATARPTFEEVCRVRSDLASIKFSPLLPSASPSKTSDPSATAKNDAVNAAPVQDAATSEDARVGVDEAEVSESPELIQLVLNGDLDGVSQFIESNPEDVNAVDRNFMTALHHAVEQNSCELVQCLLEHGCNPSLLDLRSRPPYFLCTTKEMRNVFRRFMASNPDAFDYSNSQIPSGLTDEMEQKKKEKEAEKRRRARERKKQQKKEEAEKKQQEEARQAELERKIAAGLACDFCGTYAGKSPFERLEYKYCSTDCVNNHRRKLMSEAALKRLGG